VRAVCGIVGLIHAAGTAKEGKMYIREMTPIEKRNATYQEPEPSANEEIKRVASTLGMKVEQVQRAVYLGALVVGDDHLISDAELTAFINHGFKNHRYDESGNKLPGVKS
jgi:hypothetical protein